MFECKIVIFLAPTGAQERLILVSACVSACGPSLSRALILHLFGSDRSSRKANVS